MIDMYSYEMGLLRANIMIDMYSCEMGVLREMGNNDWYVQLWDGFTSYIMIDMYSCEMGLLRV